MTQRIPVSIRTLVFGIFFLIGVLSIVTVTLWGSNLRSTFPFTLLASPLGEAAAAPTHEVLGFAPYWTIRQLEEIDYTTLTTLAYFGIPIRADGTFDTDSQGYRTFGSETAQNVFTKTRQHGRKVVVTLTNMNNAVIEQFLEDPQAGDRAIGSAVALMEQYDLDGFNIDIEYGGTARAVHRDAFTEFVRKFSDRVHQVNPHAHVSVSVYAGAMRNTQLYDIARIARHSDYIFMMAYDFATKNAAKAMPTAPLYGHKEGTYWYDVSTAVEDFLKVMPAEKLILGVPYYGYNYAVRQPGINAPTVRNRYTQSYTQTYNSAADIVPASADEYLTGWDPAGRVRWKAWRESKTLWRMVYVEDAESLREKYGYAKAKKLAGVGIWALGFDTTRTELWALLRETFASGLADTGSGI